MDAIGRPPNAVTARLGLWDAVSIIVGIIIGVGIFEIPATVFRSVPGPWEVLIVWTVGGLLALVGALCFAELASAYPRSGGEYVYLTRSCGSLVGYLFAWAQFTLLRPCNIGALAYVFALYAAHVWRIGSHTILSLAILSVAALTAINILGVTLGAAAQNVLTAVKLLGLISVIPVGFLWGSWANVATEVREVESGWFGHAMIFVLWTYAGWNEAVYVAAEVKDGRRNIPRALIAGTLGVTVIYLAVNLAYLVGTGMEVAENQLLAYDIIALATPEGGGQLIILLVMISALGAINGMIFTTGRMFAEFGVEHRVFRPLTHWSRVWGTPVRAFVVQGGVAVAMIVGVALVHDVEHGKRGLDTMIEMTAAVFWGFFFLTGLSLFILRFKDPGAPRPFRVPLYPLLPLIFCGWCGYMIYSAIVYKPEASLIGLALLAAGLPFYFMPPQRRMPPVAREPEPVPVGSGAEHG
ncbi:MAG: amino acid permease [Gemmataceae bacterium]|nr:amino acid permease [Gemmataceae bacterium]